jgi:hypothetical protein
MDYKYINQLLERYWAAETTLEEEEILRAFFSQTVIPAELEQYRWLFVYEHVAKHDDVLGSDFDERMLAMINETAETKDTEDSDSSKKEVRVKARTISLSQRLMPLFRAAAVVAIVLSLGQAAQVPFQQKDDQMQMAGTEQQTDGVSVAINGDTARIDTMQQSKAYPQRSTTDASLNEAGVFEVNEPNDNRQ